MNVAIIDADLIGRKKHRFPNLASMKLSGYYKEIADNVELKLDYENLELFDKVFISKVFTDTPFDENLLNLPNVYGGGTGLFFDKAEPLPYEIEHHMPDYNLYDDWVKQQIEKGVKPKELKDYTDRYIGYTTRGCIRGCKFCVNQNTRESVLHSPVSEFYDPSLKKSVICLNDDNVLACKDWKKIFEDLISTGKRFYYKQGMDERLLDDEKCEYIFNKSKYYGDYTFAFDRYKDRKLVQRKLELIRKHTNKQCVFYVLCGFDETGRYDEDFWKRDLIETFERIKILGSYGCLPYIMRFNKYEESPYRGIYITLARWCNQFSYFKKESLYEYVTITDYNSGGRASQKYLEHLEHTSPDIYHKYVFEKFYYKV